MDFSKEDFRDLYKNYSDARITALSLGWMHDMRIEAQEVILEEIRNRGLDKGIAETINKLAQPTTEAQMAQYCALIQSLDCPSCGRSDLKLNAELVETLKAFLVFLTWGKEVVIACPVCMRNAVAGKAKNPILASILGFPLEPFSQLYAHFSANRRLKDGIDFTPTATLKLFILENRDWIEMNKANREAFQKIVAR